jgi:hypothetical protein
VTIHDEVCSAILLFLNSGQLDNHINATNIALIPNVSILCWQQSG